MKFTVIFVVMLATVCAVSAKRFSKCELAKVLSQNGIARSALPNWICLVQSESNFNTAATNKNTNGSKDWGIFQINDRYWCKDGRRGGDCNVNCRDLLSDNISKAVTCAKIIFKRHNFNAWYGWINKCKGRPLPSVNECF